MSIKSSVARRSVSPILILLVWEGASRLGLVDTLIVPPPSVVFGAIWQLISTGELFGALWASLRRVLIGYSVAVVVGIGIGVFMGVSRVFDELVDPIVELIRPVSPLAIFPLALLWFGIGDASKVFLIALSCSFPVILSTHAAVKGIDVSLVRAARSLGASHSEVVFKVVILGCLPGAFTGMRISWGIALIVIIASEMIGAINGLGFMVLNAQQTFQVDRVFAGVIIIGLLGFATDRAFRSLQKWLIPWYVPE